MKKHLLLGCGTDHSKRFALAGEPAEWDGELVTLDYVSAYKPDVVFDLSLGDPLPFPDDTFDSIGAYEILEHIGEQGNYVLMLEQFSDYWRVLKPGSLFYATVPCYKSIWALGEPGHKRVINEGTLTFLQQPSYYGHRMMTPASEYRLHFKGDFEVVSTKHTLSGEIQNNEALHHLKKASPALFDIVTQLPVFNSHETCNFLFVLRVIKPARKEETDARRG